MNLDHIHEIRDRELDSIIGLIGRFFTSSGEALDVLELGAGSGRQALGLAARGHHVYAVDIESSAYAGSTIFPVTMYDGKHLPFQNEAFDVVVSSNVLEHVEDLQGILAEVRRVLRPGGMAIHVLPTPTWRVWTTMAHMPWLVKRCFQLAVGRQRRRRIGGDSPSHARRRSVMLDLIPHRHGERGNVLTETWYFSARWWTHAFEQNGWTAMHQAPCGLFYTGAMLLGERMNIETRRKWARMFGSSTRAYVLRPDHAGDASRASQSLDGN